MAFYFLELECGVVTATVTAEGRLTVVFLSLRHLSAASASPRSRPIVQRIDAGATIMLSVPGATGHVLFRAEFPTALYPGGHLDWS